MASADLLTPLRQVFGFSEFRPGQISVIQALLAGRSALAIFPTGAGKSLCYQLPALLLDGVTLVVSPLIALMKDQVDFLRSRSVPAAQLDSTLDAQEARQVAQDLHQHRLKVLYVAPERLASERFQQTLQRTPISLFAIDEAHCISEWGHNFRPDYLRLARLAQECKVGRVLALTATATPAVARDIARAFGISSEDVIRTGFYRPNLTLRVTPCKTSDRLNLLISKLRQRPAGATIVYVTLQRTAEEVAAALAAAGFAARAYHAGMEATARSSVQDWFMSEPAPIVVATVAFGMGIDKSAIRYVYHFNLPKSLENYAQAIGRAGRDGQPALCEMLACSTDRIVLENFVYGDTPAPEAILAVLDDVLNRGPKFGLSLHDLCGQYDLRPLVLETLLTYLELEGVLEYVGSYYLDYRFQPLKTSAQILARFDPARAAFLRQVFRRAHKLKTGFSLNVEAAAAALKQPRARIIAALNYLEEQGDLVLQVSEARQLYRRTNPSWPTGRERIELNRRLVERFTRREASDIDRLRQVLAFAQTDGCLTALLLNHFGDGSTARCGHCSWCLGDRNLILLPEEAVSLGENERTLLTALQQEKHAALQQPRQLARFLCGLSSPAASRAKLGKHPSFGALAHVPFRSVLEWVQEQMSRPRK